MKKAIYINAFRRPKYLYVVLDSLRRCHGISGWEVFVDIDGGDDSDFGFVESILPHSTRRREKNLGPRDHTTEIIRSAVTGGHDLILYGEEDSLYRSDCLDYLEKKADLDGWISCYHDQTNETGLIYMSYGPIMLKHNEASRLLEFMDKKAYTGLPNITQKNRPLEPDEFSHDSCWCAYTISLNRTQWYAPEPMTLNFGYNGVNHKDGGSFDNLAFEGDPSKWLETVVSICKERQSPHLGTVGFVYK